MRALASRLRLQLRDLRRRLLGLLTRLLAALGLGRLRVGDLHSEIHGLLRQLPSLFELALGQGFARLLLQLGDLALAVLGGLVLAHALATDLADALFRRHRQLTLGLLNALNFGEMAVDLGIERIDVLTVFAQRLHECLAFGGQNVVLDALDIGQTFVIGLPLARRGLTARGGFGVDQLQDLGRGLLAQRRLLRQRFRQVFRRLDDPLALGRARGLQLRLLLSEARLHCGDLLLQVGLDQRGEALVGLGHLGGGIVDCA